MTRVRLSRPGPHGPAADTQPLEPTTQVAAHAYSSVQLPTGAAGSASKPLVARRCPVAGRAMPNSARGSYVGAGTTHDACASHAACPWLLVLFAGRVCCMPVAFSALRSRAECLSGGVARRPHMGGFCRRLTACRRPREAETRRPRCRRGRLVWRGLWAHLISIRSVIYPARAERPLRRSPLGGPIQTRPHIVAMARRRRRRELQGASRECAAFH